MTGSVLLLYDPLVDARSVTDEADMVFARYAMNAYRANHPQEEGSGEVAMTSGQLAKRLCINGGAMLIGRALLPGSLIG